VRAIAVKKPSVGEIQQALLGLSLLLAARDVGLMVTDRLVVGLQALLVVSVGLLFCEFTGRAALPKMPARDVDEQPLDEAFGCPAFRGLRGRAGIPSGCLGRRGARLSATVASQESLQRLLFGADLRVLTLAVECGAHHYSP
jgi:hypothetical protein